MILWIIISFTCWLVFCLMDNYLEPIQEQKTVCGELGKLRSRYQSIKDCRSVRTTLPWSMIYQTWPTLSVGDVLYGCQVVRLTPLEVEFQFP